MGPKNVFDQKIFSTKNFFRPKNVFDQKIFSTKNFFRPKVFSTKKFFWPKIFSTKNIFRQKIFRPKKKHFITGQGRPFWRPKAVRHIFDGFSSPPLRGSSNIYIYIYI